ncbi:hypothetical protein [Rhizobium johnstonii]|uniref:hypothetical protein n=1 Tax=Rhizobium johnstonii TaxID=3019933 RepID=UPI003990B511
MAWVSVRALRSEIRLRLAAAFGDGFGEIGKEHGEPEPEIDLEREAEIAVARHQIAQEEDGGQHRDRGHDKHDRVSGERAGVQLLESGPHGRNEDARIHDARGFCLAHKRLQL